MDLGFRGKRALVTGASRGIGRAIAEALATEGADVAICARTAGDVDEAVAALKSKGVRSTGRAVDVADGDALRAWIAAAAEEFGGLDAVVSNVSYGGGGRTSIADWRANFEIDVLGAVHTVEAALPYLQKNGGSVIFIGSTAGIETFGIAQPYNLVKAGLINYAKNLSQMHAGKQVRFNVISPGPVYFEGGAWDRVKTAAPDRFASVMANIPMNRMASPADVANAALFLAGSMATYVTGINLVVDGGFTKRVQF
jgi:NAD(P)-dependent dehydrogenase (short-subunit alcohol dehydrogenase family)